MLREKYRHEFGKSYHWSIVCGKVFEIVIFKDNGRITIARSGKHLLDEMVDIETAGSILIPDVMVVPQLDAAKQKVCFVASSTEVLDGLSQIGLEFDPEQKLYHSCSLGKEEEYLTKIASLEYSVQHYRRKYL